MKIILLTYVNRSGSTFLANLLSKSSEILVCPEGDALMNELLVKPKNYFYSNKTLKTKLLAIFRNDPKLKWWNFSEKDLEQIPDKVSNFEAFIVLLNIYKKRIKPDAKVILFKAERLIHLFDRLMQVETKHNLIFISIIRDCRGVYASQSKTKNPESGKWMSRNPVKTAYQWNHHVIKSIELSEKGLLKIIKFEDLLIKFDYIFPEVLKAISISRYNPNEISGDLFDRLPETHKNIHKHIHSEPIQEKAWKWMFTLKKNKIMILEYISGSTLKVLGYQAENSTLKKLNIKFEYYMYYIGYCFNKFNNKLKYIFLRHK